MKKQRFELLDSIMTSGMYFVCTDTGSVWSNHRRGTWMTPSTNKRGYSTVKLTHLGKHETFTVHEIIAYSMFGESLVGLTVNHKDGTKTNNAAYNLELATMSEQHKHAIDTGLREVIRGEKLGNSKLTEAKVKEARQLFATGKYTYTKLAKLYEVSIPTVWSAIKGKTWKHVTV